VNLYGKVFNKGIFFYRIVDSMGRFLRGLYCYRSWIFTRKWIFYGFGGIFFWWRFFTLMGKIFFTGGGFLWVCLREDFYGEYIFYGERDYYGFLQ